MNLRNPWRCCGVIVFGSALVDRRESCSVAFSFDESMALALVDDEGMVEQDQESPSFKKLLESVVGDNFLTLCRVCLRMP